MQVLLFLISTYYSTKYLVIQVENCLLKLPKKVDFENSKVPNCNFSTKSVFNQCGFSNSAVCWGPKNRTIRGIPYILYVSYIFLHFFTFLCQCCAQQWQMPSVAQTASTFFMPRPKCNSTLSNEETLHQLLDMPIRNF